MLRSSPVRVPALSRHSGIDDLICAGFVVLVEEAGLADQRCAAVAGRGNPPDDRRRLGSRRLATHGVVPAWYVGRYDSTYVRCTSVCIHVCTRYICSYDDGNLPTHGDSVRTHGVGTYVGMYRQERDGSPQQP